jgi:integrase
MIKYLTCKFYSRIYVRDAFGLSIGVGSHDMMAHLAGVHWLASMLMYGSGLRLMECLRLRVKDIDFGFRQITIHNGKVSRIASPCFRKRSSHPCRDI